MSKYKNFLLTLIFLLFLGIQDAIFGQFIFHPADPFFFLMISVLGILFWGSLLFLPRLVYAAVLIIQSLLLGIVLIWHKYFKDAMPLEVLWQRFSVGLDFAKKSTETFNDPVLWGILALGICNMLICLIVFKYTRKKYSLAYALPLLIFYYFLFYVSQILRPIAFDENACKYFGYKTCWLHELSGKFKYEQETGKIVESLNQLPKINPAAPTDSRHIYVIQIETLVYDIINKKLADGREITPFLNKLAQNGQFYRIKNFKHTASANTDFAVNLGVHISERFMNYSAFSVFYEHLLPEDIYPHTRTLAQKAKDKGFYTSFYHNYMGSFFNRRPHTVAQGYDRIIFSDDMEDCGYQKEIWGYSDKDLVDLILKKQKQEPHNAEFAYIITVSSHADFILLHNPSPLLADAQTPLENYYNAINFVDNALKKFITQSPEDSVFFIFGDHDSSQISTNSVPFIIYSKQTKLSPASPREIDNVTMIALIHAQIEAARLE